MRKSIPVNENRVSLPVKVPSLRGNDEKHIILTVSDQDRNIQSLLEYIRDISSHGHSFYIEVDRANSDYSRTFSIDGDGTDKIYDIVVNEYDK